MGDTQVFRPCIRAILPYPDDTQATHVLVDDTPTLPPWVECTRGSPPGVVVDTLVTTPSETGGTQAPPEAVDTQGMAPYDSALLLDGTQALPWDRYGSVGDSTIARRDRAARCHT